MLPVTALYRLKENINDSESSIRGFDFNLNTNARLWQDDNNLEQDGIGVNDLRIELIFVKKSIFNQRAA